MTEKKDIVVYIGRFQPLHNGHVQTIINAAKIAKRVVVIVGHGKDESSAYLRWFPQWELIEQELVEPLDATQIRSLYFSENSNPNFIRSVVPSSTIDFLTGFSNGNEYKQMNSRTRVHREVQEAIRVSSISAYLRYSRCRRRSGGTRSSDQAQGRAR